MDRKRAKITIQNELMVTRMILWTMTKTVLNGLIVIVTVTMIKLEEYCEYDYRYYDQLRLMKS